MEEEEEEEAEGGAGGRGKERAGGGGGTRNHGDRNQGREDLHERLWKNKKFEREM